MSLALSFSRAAASCGSTPPAAPVFAAAAAADSDWSAGLRSKNPMGCQQTHPGPRREAVLLKESPQGRRYDGTMNLHGPDFLLAFGFALLGLGVGLVWGVGLAFWLAGLHPAREHHPRLQP